MNTLKFEGYSDDTFSCEGRGIDVDHDDCARGTLRAIKMTAHGYSMIVTGQYCPGTLTSWAIGIALVEGDDDCQALPTWPLRWKGREGGYSPILEIDAPDDVAAELIYAGED